MFLASVHYGRGPLGHQSGRGCVQVRVHYASRGMCSSETVTCPGLSIDRSDTAPNQCQEIVDGVGSFMFMPIPQLMVPSTFSSDHTAINSPL